MKVTTDLEKQVEKLSSRNVKLAGLLQESRDKLQQMFAEVNALSEPASTYGCLLYTSPSPRDA